MIRIRTAWLVAVVALTVSGAACKKNDDAKKDDKSSATGSAGGGGDKAAPAPTDNKVAQITDANGGGDLSLLPADSEMVLGINFAQLQTSPLFKQFAQKFMDKAASGLDEFKTACGFDPMSSIKTMSIGMKGVGAGEKPDGAMVIHGPDKAKVMACLDKAKAEASKKGTEMTVDGDIVTVKSKDGQNVAFTFVNDSTMLGVIGTKANADGVKDAAKGASALKTSGTFVEMYGKINTQDSLWLLINGNSKMLDKASSLGVKPKAVFGSVNLTDGLTVDLRIRMATADEVKGFVGMAQGQIQNPQVKQLFDQLDINQDDKDAKITVKMSAAKLQALASMVGNMMGGMMGGGGAMGGPGGP